MLKTMNPIGAHSLIPDDEPTGPWWEMTFVPTMAEQKLAALTG
jgi:hypothetical protein